MTTSVTGFLKICFSTSVLFRPRKGSFFLSFNPGYFHPRKGLFFFFFFLTRSSILYVLFSLQDHLSCMFFSFSLPGGAMPSPLKERMGRCCFFFLIWRGYYFLRLMVYRRLFFLLGFSFCCFNLGPASPEEG